MEQDEAFYASEDIWIENKSTGKHFVVKESVTEDDPALLQEAVKGFDEALDAFMEYLAITPEGDITLDTLSPVYRRGLFPAVLSRKRICVES